MSGKLTGFAYFVAAGALLSAAPLFGQSKLPPPKVDAVFNLHLELGKPSDVGTVSAAGMRRVVPVTGGVLEGPGMGGAVLKGKILPGADYQIIRPDGLTEIDAHYVVQLESGDLIYVTNRGMRHGPPELLAKLAAGEKIDQSKIYFHTVISVETAAKSLDWMNKSIFVSTGERLPSEAVIHVYRLN
ncbi:MAG TPA: DUF3237 domain-containing protein [Bryobacteraceae bacterium]|nr:DUF3237 domain-containing protein [Bryobacteraceae bacterium]